VIRGAKSGPRMFKARLGPDTAGTSETSVNSGKNRA
jgi:hypothetical protein